MKNKLVFTKLCAQAMVATCALTLGLGAEAKGCCGSISKVGGDISKGANDVGKSAGNTVNQGVDAGKSVVNDTSKLVAASADLSKSDMNNLYNQAKSVYSATAGEVKNGYDQSVSAVKAAWTDAIFALYNKAGKAAMSKYSNQFKGMVNQARKLDREGQDALNRITRAISAQKIDDQVRKDMQLLATKIGVLSGGANVPGNVQKSSFGIQMTTSAADGVGVEQTFGIIMNTFMESGQYKVGFTQSLGVSYGLQVGASTSVGIFWGPGSMDDASGPSVGLNYELENIEVGGAGGAASLSWGIPSGLLKGSAGVQDLIPGFSAGLGVGGKVQFGTLSAGYTKLFGKV
jgi:hypothetical protein